MSVARSASWLSVVVAVLVIVGGCTGGMRAASVRFEGATYYVMAPPNLLVDAGSLTPIGEATDIDTDVASPTVFRLEGVDPIRAIALQDSNGRFVASLAAPGVDAQPRPADIPGLCRYFVDEPGCPPEPAPSQAAGPALATSPPSSNGGGDARGEGVLGGELRDGAACFWLIGPNGKPGAALVWPYGFSASGDPLAVVGSDGEVVARPGDTIVIGGGGPPVDYAIPPDRDPCGIGSVFVVGEVLPAN